MLTLLLGLAPLHATAAALLKLADTAPAQQGQYLSLSLAGMQIAAVLNQVCPCLRHTNPPVSKLQAIQHAQQFYVNAASDRRIKE